VIGWLFAVAAFAGVDPTPCTDAGAMTANSTRLRQLFDEDTADRQNRDPDVYKHDKVRVKEILELQKAGQLCSSSDYYLAAAVAQHSQDPEEIKSAYDMAVQAMNTGKRPEEIAVASTLVANVFDRWKISRGLDQWYGTQFATADGHRCIFEVDPKATDEERTQHGVALLADTYAKLLQDVGKGGYDPTSESLVRYGLVCENKAWR
jgi:hypothetical protein